MKKCPTCEREVDKMAIVCEYCGRLEKANQEKSKKPADPDSKKGN